MKMFSFGIAMLAALAVASSAEAGRRGGYSCGGSSGYSAPAAASPAAVDPATPAAPAMAQNQAPGSYRSFSYQPAAAPVSNNSGYSRGYNGRSNQPMWMNGANKSLGRYN